MKTCIGSCLVLSCTREMLVVGKRAIMDRRIKELVLRHDTVARFP